MLGEKKRIAQVLVFIPVNFSLNQELDSLPTSFSSVTAVDSGRKAMELIGPKGQGKLGSSDTDANVSTEMHDPSPCARPITHHRSYLQMQSCLKLPPFFCTWELQ